MVMIKMGQWEACDSIHMQSTHAAIISRKSPTVEMKEAEELGAQAHYERVCVCVSVY